MDEQKEVVPFEEAGDQVRLAMIRLALMHLAFSKTLVEELGEEKGRELIIKSILEYGKRVGERTKQGHQDLPFYGVHDRCTYENQTYRDTREVPRTRGWNFSLYRAYGCIFAKIFKEYGEEDLGRLYCYVDAAKSMAADLSHKLIHTLCEPCGDECCAFALVDSTEKERKDFLNKDKEWKHVDPVLVRGKKKE